MRLLATAFVAAFVAGAVVPAEAQQRTRSQRASVSDPGATYVRHTDEQGRTRTKILVQKRSYLDGGTEVMPGSVNTNRESMINSMYYSPSSATVSNNNVWQTRPVPDPFFLPGKDNPFFR
jgi:hypothetical protein